MASKQENKRALNRANVVLILVIFALSWVMINAGEFITAALIYIVMGLTSITFNLNWDKIRLFGK